MAILIIFLRSCIFPLTLGSMKTFVHTSRYVESRPQKIFMHKKKIKTIKLINIMIIIMKIK
jgi:hypothetical protein